MIPPGQQTHDGPAEKNSGGRRGRNDTVLVELERRDRAHERREHDDVLDEQRARKETPHRARATVEHVHALGEEELDGEEERLERGALERVPAGARRGRARA
jgi:hypothetical protein